MGENLRPSDKCREPVLLHYCMAVQAEHAVLLNGGVIRYLSSQQFKIPPAAAAAVHFFSIAQQSSSLSTLLCGSSNFWFFEFGF